MLGVWGRAASGLLGSPRFVVQVSYSTVLEGEEGRGETLSLGMFA